MTGSRSAAALRKQADRWRASAVGERLSPRAAIIVVGIISLALWLAAIKLIILSVG